MLGLGPGASKAWTGDILERDLIVFLFLQAVSPSLFFLGSPILFSQDASLPHPPTGLSLSTLPVRELPLPSASSHVLSSYVELRLAPRPNLAPL